jgi:RHS repeat-associated protein
VAYTYHWNKVGRIVTIDDDAGRHYTATYDPLGRPTEWQAPAINVQQVYTHQWSYDGNGRLRRLRWKYYSGDLDMAGTWIEWKYTYDPLGHLLSCVRQLDADSPPAYATESWEYDLHGNPTAAVDADAYRTTVTYDERDLPWVLTDGSGSTEATSKSYEYNADGRLAVIVERLDATHQTRFENEYDGLGRLTRYRIKDAANLAVQAGYIETDYDSGSHIAELRTYALDAGIARLVGKQAFLYNDFHGCPTRQTTNVYRATDGVFLRAIQSDFQYGPSGRPVREWTGTNLIAEYTYETCGLPKRTQDAYGNRLELAWDQYGRVLTETNAYWSPVDATHLVTTRTFGRDQFGRATSITDSGSGVTNQVTTFMFDSNDNVVRKTSPDGSSAVFEWRYDGLLIREDALIAGSTMRARQSTYTPGGRLSSVIDDRGNQVSQIYDGRGRLKQQVYPDSSIWANEHNDANLLTKITAPTGRTVEFAYDWRGMATGVTYKNPSGAVLRSDAIEIDLCGFVKKVTKTEGASVGYVSMTNDSTGRVMSETTSLPGGIVSTVDYSFDALGRMASITSPRGYLHTYDYDDRNRVSQIQLTDPNSDTEQVATYGYLGAMGSVRQRVTGDGNTLNVTRDGFGRVTRMQTNGASNVADNNYTYDDANRVVSEFRAYEGKGDAFWYDKLGRLTKTTRESVNPAAELGSPQSTTHSYFREFYHDGDDHRTQVRSTPMGSATEVTNYLTATARHSYTQIQTVGQSAISRSSDLDGRLTAHGSRTFVYDTVDNLTEVKDAGITVATYTYDALGRRATKTTGGYTTRFVNAGPWVLEDYCKNNGGTGIEWLKGTYVHGPGIDNVVMMRHRDWKDVDSDADKVEPVSVYLHANKQGSVTEVTDPSGNVIERYRYDEYGKPKVLSATYVQLAAAIVGNWFLFTGREYDFETGYYYYRSRTYDPGTGTFLQEDPLGEHDGLNVVAYVHANPVNLSDPYGTDGIGDVIQSIMDFINNNRELVAGLIMDLLGPLEGILDLISAATGKDITGWLRGGMKGDGPEAMGWWDRACAAASAAVTIAAGAAKLFPKLKSILQKIEDVVEKLKGAVATKAQDLAKCVGGCFLAGTLVAMGNGSFVPIESVGSGQCVRCEVPGAMPGLLGVEQTQAVVDASVRVYEGPIITVVVVACSGVQAEISGTPEHPFWCVSRHEWVPLGSLAVGDRLDGLNGDVGVVGRKVAFGRARVFNFTVEQAHSYRVSELGVLVHNSYDPTRVARLQEIMVDPDTPAHISGWLRQEFNRGGHIRMPPGYDLAHKQGRMRRQGYTHQSSPSSMQTGELHDLQHHRPGGYRN